MLKYLIGMLLGVLIFGWAGESKAAPINIAPTHGIASASSSYSISSLPQFAIDGDPQTMWNAGTHGTPSAPRSLVVDLQQSFQISEIKLQTIISPSGSIYRGFTNAYNLYTSTDGIAWNSVGSGTLVEETNPTSYSDIFNISGPNSTLRYVKYEVVGGTHWAHLNELHISAVPLPGAVWLFVSGVLAAYGVSQRKR